MTGSQQWIARGRRAWRILRVILRWRLDRLIKAAGLAPYLPWSMRLLLGLLRVFLWRRPEGSLAWCLRCSLEDLGPVFVKFGQLLSTRPDLLTSEFAEELRKLQDRVTPFSGEIARTVIEDALGSPLETVFAHFEIAPMAAASVAQVHAATLHDGSDVVVKVIRPGIEELITDDLRLLKGIAGLLERLGPGVRRLQPVAVVLDYERTIMNELDLLHEAANAARLRRNFANSPLLYVPKVHWACTRRNLLVLERIYGTPIADVSALRRAGTNMKLLADRGVETFFTQVFEDNFFHADMHPGNIFVDISDPAEPSYIAVDCAVIGTLTESDQDYLARNLLAFFNQDYHQVARLHLASGWVKADTDLDEFERVIRTLCEPLFQKPISEISFGYFLLSLLQAARTFDMEVQPQLVLLQKTLLYVEGVGRQLYPQLDLWATAKPFMERWMARRTGPAATLLKVAERAPALLEQLPRLPELVLRTVRQLQHLDDIARTQKETQAMLRQLVDEQEKSAWRRRVAGYAAVIAGAGLLLPAMAMAGGSASGLPGGLLAFLGLLLLSGRI